MAVFTPLTRDDIASFLRAYDIGDFISAEGITEGVENTNYLLTTAQGKFILTLFEGRTRIEDLPYFTSLMEWFHGRGIRCPQPITRKDGRVLSALKEKAALIVTFLEGSGVQVIRQDHLPQIGKLAAKMHIAGQEFPYSRANMLSIEGWHELARKVSESANQIEDGLYSLINSELSFLSEYWPAGLPNGPIHADLFPDNIFFVRERGGWNLSGVIDFYFSCNDAWAYDLAVIINAWCFDDRHRFVPERTQALMASYCADRPLMPEEERAMPILLRGAALRFLLTRAHDWLFTPQDADVRRKDPLEYAVKLRFFQQQPL